MNARAASAISSKTLSARVLRALQHAIAVIGGLEPMQCRVRQPRHERLEQRALRELVARAREEQHRLANRRQVLRALRIRLAGHVQRERAEDQPRGRHGSVDDGVRRHAAAERMPADPERQRRALGSRRERGGDGLGGHGRRIDAVAPRRHVRKIETQRRDAALLERRCDRLHARVRHAGPGAVREHERGHCIVRALPQHRRDAYRTVHSYGSSVTLGSHNQYWRSTTGRVNVFAIRHRHLVVEPAAVGRRREALDDLDVGALANSELTEERPADARRSDDETCPIPPADRVAERRPAP